MGGGSKRAGFEILGWILGEWMMGAEGLLIHLGVNPADLILEEEIRVGA